MRTTSAPLTLVMAVAAFVGCAPAPASDAVATASVDAAPSGADLYPEDAYPADVSPPPGLRYPCALAALPRDPVGIPAADRLYVNHAYSRILRATRAKLLVLDALYDDVPRVEAENARYQETLATLLARMRAETPPAGLEEFRDDVVAAFEQQGAFFAKAAPLRRSGGSMDAVMALPEGQTASARLQSAWGRMVQRYPSWDEATKDSIYHHLCALDLF